MGDLKYLIKLLSKESSNFSVTNNKHIEDTFLLFRQPYHDQLFLSYVNKWNQGYMWKWS